MNDDFDNSKDDKAMLEKLHKQEVPLGHIRLVLRSFFGTKDNEIQDLPLEELRNLHDEIEHNCPWYECPSKEVL